MSPLTSAETLPLASASTLAGLEALVAEAARAGVRRFLYVSNAAVCGWAIQRGDDEARAAGRLRRRPSADLGSLPSAAVLNAGGLVLRPLFVYGPGDTRFVPAIARAARRLRIRPAGGQARVSVVAVDSLAAAIADLVAAPTWSTGVMHANDGQPVSLNEILATLERALGVPAPRLSVSWPLLRLLVRALPARLVGGGGRATVEHRLFLISRDHYFDSGRLWQTLGPIARAALPRALRRLP